MSVPSWVRPGAKCVCIKVGDWELRDGIPGSETRHPVLDGIYTIESSDEWLGEAYLSFLGLDPLDKYAAVRFRPLVTKSLEQDSAMFRKLLQPERADA